MRQCLNLRELFGDRFKIALDESYSAEKPEFRREELPWLMILLCENGHICPWGGNDLAACTSRAGAVAKALRRLPFTRVVQDGSDGVNAVFDASHFDEVAALMKPRRRRRLSDEARERLAAAGAATRFARECGTQAASDDRPCVVVGQVDGRHSPAATQPKIVSGATRAP